MNIIFIDFDGVLCTYHYKSDEDIENKIKILSNICQKLNCKVVIESAHKDDIDEKTLEVDTTYGSYAKYVLDLLRKHGIEVIGRTPVLTSKYSYNHLKPEFIKELKSRYYEYKKIVEQQKLLYENNKKSVISLDQDYLQERRLFYIREWNDLKLSDYLNKYLYSKVNIWKEDEIRIYLMRHPEIEHYAILDDDDLGPLKSDLNKVREHLVKTINYDEKNPEKEGLLPYHEEEISRILSKENKIRSYVLSMNNKNK